MLLKYDLGFLACAPVDMTIIDRPAVVGARFTLIYILKSLTLSKQIFVKLGMADTSSILSVQSLFPALGWAEREIWDLFGVVFVNHPDLRRILTDYGFIGSPLKKDFPVTGYSEIHFDEPLKALEYKPVELAQAFRVFKRPKIWRDLK